MRWQNCSADNVTGSKFCNQCAAPLGAKCQNCGFVNAPKARFCAQCAAAINAASEISDGSTAELKSGLLYLNQDQDAGRVADGERKRVTALFADIKGSMELMEGLDPEEARPIIDPALRLMIDAVHRYDGHIVQSTGGHLENHPQRALCAPLRSRRMRRCGEVLGTEGIYLQVCVGSTPAR